MAGVTAFDVAVLGVIGLSVLVSLIRGLTREALAILTWIGALGVAWFGYPYADELAQKTIAEPWIAHAAALALVFLVPLIAFKVVAGIIAAHLPGGVFGTLDRTVGIAFGVVRGVAIVCAAYLGLSMVLEPASHPPWVTGARSLPYVQRGADWLRGLVPEEVRAQSRDAMEALEERAWGEIGEATKTLPVPVEPSP
jgi:membrane protein required for colicin V production